MKKPVLLLVLISIISACQRHQYPQMSKPQFESYNARNQAQPLSGTALSAQSVSAVEEILAASSSVETAPVAAASVETASTVEGVESVVALDNVSASIPAEAIKEAYKVETAPAKPSWKERMIAGKLERKINKATAPREAKADGQSKTVPRLSLIFGTLGLVMLIAGIVPGIAILFGIAGLVLGIVGLSQIRKGESPRSSKAAALIGLIFGGAVILFLLLAIYAIAAFGFA